MTRFVSRICRLLGTAVLPLATAGMSPAWGQDVLTLGELRAQSPATLTRAELQTLLPGAGMSRTNEKGSTHRWTNEPDGKIVVSSDNRGRSGRGSRATGTWTLDDEGRFCMVVQWRLGESEDSCRFVLKVGDAYWAASSLRSDSQKVYRVVVSK